MKTGSCICILNNWVYQGHTGVIMINIDLYLIALANTFSIRAKGGNTYAFTVSNHEAINTNSFMVQSI